MEEKRPGEIGDGHVLEAKNAINRDAPLTALMPDGMMLELGTPELFDRDGTPVNRIIHGTPSVLRIPLTAGITYAEDAIFLKRTLAPITGR